MALIFDFDSTLIKDESLVSLLKHSILEMENNNPTESNPISSSSSSSSCSLLVDQIMQITNRGITNEITMIQSYRERLAIARPTRASIESYLNMASDLLTDGMVPMIQNLKRLYPSLQVRVVSQGPRCIVEPIAQQFFGISSQFVHCVNLNMETMDVDENDEMLLLGKSKVLKRVLSCNTTNTSPVVIVGDGVSDMKVRVDGVAHVAIGFGQWLQFEKTRELSDYYVHSVKELEPILIKCFCDLNLGVEQRRAVHNFFAGPSALPTEVLQHMNRELLSYQDTGISLMEYSHRSKEFDAVIHSTEQLVRDLLHIPNEYAVLFTQGGATLQFASIPLNLRAHEGQDVVNYIVTGEWSKKASNEARKVLSQTNTVVNIIADTTNLSTLPNVNDLKYDSEAKSSTYTYYCDNETVHGLEFPEIPTIDPSIGGFLVCDMSSNLFTRPFDIRKYGLVYSCAQKNFGIAGLTLIIVRRDLIGKASDNIPSYLDYKCMDDNKSMGNTPPSFAIYTTKLVLEWIKKNGGVEQMHSKCVARSKQLYNLIDSSHLYHGLVGEGLYRSRLNIVFRLKPDGQQADDELEKKFVNQATKEGLVGLAGHRAVGGVRVSIYNATTDAGVAHLLDFMKRFERENK